MTRHMNRLFILVKCCRINQRCHIDASGHLASWPWSANELKKGGCSIGSLRLTSVHDLKSKIALGKIKCVYIKIVTWTRKGDHVLGSWGISSHTVRSFSSDPSADLSHSSSVALTSARMTRTPASWHFTAQLPFSNRVNRPVTFGYREITPDRDSLNGSNSKDPNGKRPCGGNGAPWHDPARITVKSLENAKMVSHKSNREGMTVPTNNQQCKTLNINFKTKNPSCTEHMGGVSD
ncbi:hypothetical protein CFP56_021014 [Quercus suber]|uniref:Uncharacterized protein n=1 Tax=Quercus suber TaxID=58331 RepID=A0AAW0KGE8_QUESU